MQAQFSNQHFENIYYAHIKHAKFIKPRIPHNHILTLAFVHLYAIGTRGQLICGRPTNGDAINQSTMNNNDHRSIRAQYFCTQYSTLANAENAALLLLLHTIREALVGLVGLHN